MAAKIIHVPELPCPKCRRQVGLLGFELAAQIDVVDAKERVPTHTFTCECGEVLHLVIRYERSSPGKAVPVRVQLET